MYMVVKAHVQTTLHYELNGTRVRSNLLTDNRLKN